MNNDFGSIMSMGWDHSLPAADRNEDALFRTIFTAEVWSAYAENLLLQPLIQHRTITSGIREQFTRTWKQTAERHERGAEMIGQDMEAKSVTIEIDKRPLYVSNLFDDIDLLKTHFDKRSEASNQMGQALSRTVDSHVARLLLNAARWTKAAGDESSFPDGGGAIHNTDLAITSSSTAAENNDAAGAVLQAIGQAFRQFDENDVPVESLNVAVRPMLWHALLEYGVPFDNTAIAGGQRPLFADQFVAGPKFGDLSQFPGRSTPLMYRGVRIWNSPSVPTEDFTGVDEAKYQGDFTNTAGMIWHQDAAAYLQLMGLTMEHSREATRGADFVSLRLHGGGGTMRPEAAIELRQDAE